MIRADINEITNVLTEIERITKEYYNHIYANKGENLDELEKFLVSYYQNGLKM